ncbi:MAG: alpha-amylase family glycosyl hydrolase [Phycisphaerales bacterium]
MRYALAALLLAAPALAAEHDGDVEWSGVSHVVWQDLRPLVPMRSDAFSVRFQAYRGDLTGASVLASVNGSQTSYPASIVGQLGPYDVWSADLPGTSADELTYVISLTDGGDTDYLGPDGMSADEPSSGFTLDFATLAHAPVGSTPIAGGTVFKVWAPTRTTCHVRGEFNGWSTANPLTKVGEYFIGFVPGAVAGQMYKYYFNNSVWNTDPRARRLNPTDNLNAYIVDPLAYQWQHDDFIADPLDRFVIYQLHVGSFSGRNDPFGPAPTPSGYRDVGERAAHLEELGVNAVMVNPIDEFPGDFSGGYNPTTMYSWEWALGTPDDLKYMVDELHAHGIAVLLDVVWNHFAVNDNFLWNYDGSQSYFDTPHQDTPWGAQANYDAPGVFAYYLDSVHYVMGEFRMDGYRQDAVMAMTDSGWTAQWPAGQELVRQMNDTIDNRYADANTIAEIYIDNPWVQTGLHFDTQYHNSFKNALRSAVFDAAFTSPNVSAVAAAIDGTGGVSGTQVLNYFELHDDAWPLNGHERAVTEIDTSSPHDDQYARGRTTLANALVLLSSGVPAILQGTEWLEDEGWEENKIDWAHKITYAPIFDYYKTLVTLRTSEPALAADADVWVYHVNEGADVIAFERWQDGGKSFVVVANMGNTDWTDYRLGLPREGTWGVVVNNQATEFGGPGAGTMGVFETEPISSGPHAQSAVLNIPARGLLLLEHEPAGVACNAADVAEPFGTLDFSDVIAFLVAFGAMEPEGDLAAPFGVFDFSDVLEYLGAFGAGCP